MAEKRRFLVTCEVTLTEVQGVVFEDRVVKTTGFHFIGCKFVRCTLWGDQPLALLDCCHFVDCTMLDVDPASLKDEN